MLKHALKITAIVAMAGVSFSSCKKGSEINHSIPQINHMQFTLSGDTHSLTNMKAFTDSISGTSLKELTLNGYNMANSVTVGESMMINIFYNTALKAGDTFVTGSQNTNTNAEFSYIPSATPGAVIGISFLGEPGTVTITGVSPTAVTGTFSIQLYPFADYSNFSGNNNLGPPAYIITNGSFYANF
jgi:hypothetical protein